ncbi:hypothetical protein CU097_001591, partial [Rhizopus azygosporus]
LKWLTFKTTMVILFIALFVAIYYGFHGLLADSVLMDKDRVAAKDNIQNVLQKSAARRAAAATGDKKDS